MDETMSIKKERKKNKQVYWRKAGGEGQMHNKKMTEIHLNLQSG